jgi:hypothetical protein
MPCRWLIVHSLKCQDCRLFSRRRPIKTSIEKIQISTALATGVRLLLLRRCGQCVPRGKSCRNWVYFGRPSTCRWSPRIRNRCLPETHDFLLNRDLNFDLTGQRILAKYWYLNQEVCDFDLLCDVVGRALLLIVHRIAWIARFSSATCWWVMVT